jgi:hypothetical protein
MKFYTEEKFLSLISASLLFNQSLTLRQDYCDFLCRIINDAKEIIKKHPDDQFFILAIPLDDKIDQAVLEYFPQFKTFVFNKTYGRTEELGIVHVMMEDDSIVEAIDA